MNKFAVLTTADTPAIAATLAELRKRNLVPTAVIVDGRLSQRDLTIVRDRLEPGYEIAAIWDFDIVDFPVYFVTDHNGISCQKLVTTLALDFLVNSGTPRILKRPLLESTQGVLNCHPGILPAYRGCTAVEWSIFNNDPVGASVHLMSEKIDEGALILTREMKIEKGDSYRKVRTQMISHQASTLAEGVARAVTAENIISISTPQQPGTYHKPIPAEYLIQVKAKLEKGEYAP